MSEQADCRLSLPKDVDWTLFNKHGRSLFLELFSLILNVLSQKDSTLYAHALKTRASFVERNQPFPNQQRPLSELQLFVKRARKTLVDPILARFEQFSSPEASSSEEEADPEEVRRQQVRETEGVIIRCDVEDEDVDIDLGDGLALEACEEKMNGDPPLKGSPSTIVTNSRVGNRIRRPTIKKANVNGTGNIKGRTKSSSMVVPLGPPAAPQSPPEDTSFSENPPEELKSKRKTKGPKPKPETYKQSWSVSEQNLLEQLLEEIPDGEKFRHVFFFPCMLSFVIADPLSFFFLTDGRRYHALWVASGRLARWLVVCRNISKS